MDASAAVMLSVLTLFGGAWLYLLVRLRQRQRRLAWAQRQWPPGCDIVARRQYAAQRVEHWWRRACDAHAAELGEAPRVEFSPRLKHALGWADSSRRLIKISDWHLMDKPREVADETVAHEVAHIFADLYHGRACRHDRRWKAVMVKLGQKPDVCFIEGPHTADGPDGPQRPDEPAAPVGAGGPLGAARE
jgi:hypothetical protein